MRLFIFEQRIDSVFIIAKGNSMYPALIDGNKYIVDESNISNIQSGDIIVYYANEKVICHRVIHIIKAKNSDVFYKTKGDNCPNPDPFAVRLEHGY